MSWTVWYLILCPSSGSVSGQGQLTNVKVVESGNPDQLCPSMDEREGAKNELHQIANSVIMATVTGFLHTCNGTPG